MSKNKGTMDIMDWKKKYHKEWGIFYPLIAEPNDIHNALSLLRALDKESLYDIAYIITTSLGSTHCGEQVEREISDEVFKELWGDKAQEQYVKRYIEIMNIKLIEEDSKNE